MSKSRIMVVDDHALVREGIAALLAHYDDVVVVGAAADGKEAIEKVAKLGPDIVLMDIAMPGLGGLEATLEIKKSHPQVKILVLSQYGDKEYISRFLKAGVSGYILKKAIGSELITAIRAIVSGEKYLYPEVASELIEDYIAADKKNDDDSYQQLTDREKQILKLIAEGHTQKEVAVTLNISIKTVTAHQSNISQKLELHSKAELIKFAIQKGIIKI